MIRRAKRWVLERGGYRGVEKAIDFEPPHRMPYTVLCGFAVVSHLGERILESNSEGTALE